MKTTALWVTAAFLVAAPALADSPATPAPAGAADVQNAPTTEQSYLDKVVCKKEPPRTGTLLGARRVCHTEREWREITRNSQEDVSHRQTFHSSLPGE